MQLTYALRKRWESLHEKKDGKRFFYGEIFCEISWVIFEKKRKKKLVDSTLISFRNTRKI